MIDNVRVRPDTRNHKGFFVLESSYKLIDVNRNGWALICLDDATCHYVDPDDLKMPRSWKKAEASIEANNPVSA